MPARPGHADVPYAVPHHRAWPAGFPRHGRVPPPLRQPEPGQHLGAAARSAGLVRQMARHRAPWSARQSLQVPSGTAGLLRLRRTDLAGKARRPCHRDRSFLRRQIAHRGQGGPRRPGVFRQPDPAPPRSSATRRRTTSSETPGRCCSLSTGQSPSAWQ